MKIKIISYPIFYLLLFSIIFLGCKDDPEAIISVKNDPNFVIVSEKVVFLDKGQYSANIISVSADSSTFIFKTSSMNIDNLVPGNIIVSDKDKGILRKIKSINKTSEQIICQTEQATLAEALQRAKINFTRKITKEDIEREIYSKEGVFNSISDAKLEFAFDFIDVVIYDRDGNINTKNDQVKLNGRLEIDPWFGMLIEIDNYKLKECKISYDITEILKIECSATLINFNFEKEILIKSYKLKPIVFFVGWFPIVVTPSLHFYLGANGLIKAGITTKIEQNANFSAGLKFANNRWEPFSTLTHNFGFIPPTFSAEAKLEGYIKPKMDLMIYGVAGPYTNVKLAGEFDISISPETAARLYGIIYVGVGGKIQILDKNIPIFDKPDLIIVKIKLWEKSNLGGKISGNVKNAVTNELLSNVKVVAYKNNLIVDSTSTKSDGTYELGLPIYDNYKIVFSKIGFLDAEYFGVKVELLGNTVLETVLQIDLNYRGFGSISGKIKNALTGMGVANLELKLRKGINQKTGSVIKTTTTSSVGSYTFSNIEAGNYTIEISGSGYNQTFFNVICIGGQNLMNQDATVTPILSPGETRIILTWGANPPDLDSHLTGPLPSGGRFHMFFVYKGNNSPWPNIVNLDLDDVDGYGPETTTLYSQIEGTYRFYVHDYTNRNKTYSLALSNSGAVVRVYKSSGLVASFVVPPNREGTLWTVFEMTGSSITPINSFSYVSDPRNVGNLGKKSIDEHIDIIKK